MSHTEIHPGCPALSALVDWFEGTLDASEADRVEEHLDHCGHCRQRTLAWSERVETSASDAAAPAGCVDAETLVAYCSTQGGLEHAAVAHVEEHLRQCARCVGNLQDFMRRERQLDTSASAPAVQAEPSPAVVATQAAELSGARRPISTVPMWWERLRDLMTPTVWSGAALAAAMALVIAIGVSRFVSPSGLYQEMRVRNATQTDTVEVTTDTVGRPRPSAEEPIVAELSPGTQARWLETNGKWTRIELADGRRVWVESHAVARTRAD